MADRETSPNRVVLSAREIAKTYGRLEALTDFTLEVRAGEILGLLGPNGAGKTTAIRVLTTILPASRGHFAVMDIPDSRPEQIRALIGVLPESNGFPMTVTGADFLAVLLSSVDSFSGERDRHTLESLLLTPVPRGQLAAGKLLAILSLWLGMIPIAVPYIALVADGTEVAMTSVMLLVVSGTLLVGLSAGVEVLVSALSPKNLVSYTAAFALMLLLAEPTQLLGSVRDLSFVHWFIVSNPITAVASYQSAVIDGAAWTKGVGLLLSPVIALALAVGLGPRLLNSRLSLQGGLQP